MTGTANARAGLSFFRDRSIATRFAFYAGSAGWENTEYVELLASAGEAMGTEAVVPVVAPPRRRLLHCVIFLVRARPSHFFYDPRWGLQGRVGAQFEGCVIGATLALIRCVPVSLLNDLPEVNWRKKISLVNGNRGICVVLVDPEIGQIYAPEIKNQVGPMPMALSMQRLQYLKKRWRAYEQKPNTGSLKIGFVGSLYEPRTSILNEAKSRLKPKGLDLVIHGRSLGDPKIGANQYFELLAQAPLTFTTADQAQTESTLNFPIHLVYRYIEALASGTALIAPSVPGAEIYFVPGIHYIECPDLDYLVEKIPSELSDWKGIEKVREHGRARVEELVAAKFFWTRIDRELASRGFRKILPKS